MARSWTRIKTVLPLLLHWLASSMPTMATPNPTPVDESGEIVDWLTRYGYLPLPDPVSGKLQTWEAVTSAIQSMQRFAGIAETGIPDDVTLALIRTPRCSLPDISPVILEKRKRKRRSKKRMPRSAGSSWGKKNISWKVKSYPRHSFLSRETMRVLMYYALKVWSDTTPLNFHEVRARNPDIVVEFMQREHQDGYPFDGVGGMVAHAFFPDDPIRAGNVHFDSDENWTFRSAEDYGTDLFAVAVHEFGHSLGLAHSSLKRSIMRPYYQGPVGDPLQYQLNADDRAKIQGLYGSQDLHSTEQPAMTAELGELSPSPQEIPSFRSGRKIPDRCILGVDAVTQIRGETFFFKGQYFWRLTAARHLTSLHPAMIQGFWRGFPGTLEKVDAVYERHVDHRILFFSGRQYWVFKDNGMEEGYPRPVTDFGLPEAGVDGAFSHPQDSKTYFFKDGRHWRYDEVVKQMDAGYPEENSVWLHLPSPIDDVISGADGSVYQIMTAEYMNPTDNVKVKRALCVIIPCKFDFPSTITLGDNPHTYWFKEAASTRTDKPLSTIDDCKEVSENTSDCFHLLGGSEKHNCALRLNDASEEEEGRYFFRTEGKSLYIFFKSKPFMNEIEQLKSSHPAMLPATVPVNIACTAPGRCTGSAPIITWTGTSNTPNASSRNGNETVLYASSITFTPSLRDHNKTLTCMIYHPVVEASMQTNVSLNVAYRSAYLNQMASNCTEEGYSVMCTCMIQSDPLPVLQWFVNEEVVAGNYNNQTLQLTTTVKEKIANSRLTLKKKKKSQNLKIQCWNANKSTTITRTQNL
uniref:Matrix metalloproteinase-17-like isoform X2 n=1 Tax=Geotrypetes seraphini TaxID=260995 RepID=A0A6P8NLH8_GEOSA|nr:matrix metalloproteinase-17-like isoform X2 [Geotrypetes seraphini]